MAALVGRDWPLGQVPILLRDKAKKISRGLVGGKKSRADCLQAGRICGLSILMTNQMPERRAYARIESSAARNGFPEGSNETEGLAVNLRRVAGLA